MLGNSHPEVICKRCLLKISQNSQGNTCAGISILRKLQNIYEFSEILRNNFFARHLRTATSECSPFHDFSEKKHCFKSKNNCKSKRKDVYILKWRFRYAAYFIKTILNKASLIFAFTVFLTDSLHSSKIDFIMFNVSHKSLQNMQPKNCR